MGCLYNVRLWGLQSNVYVYMVNKVGYPRENFMFRRIIYAGRGWLSA